jgi:hypothetical protein
MKKKKLNANNSKYASPNSNIVNNCSECSEDDLKSNTYVKNKSIEIGDDAFEDNEFDENQDFEDDKGFDESNEFDENQDFDNNDLKETKENNDKKIGYSHLRSKGLFQNIWWKKGILKGFLVWLLIVVIFYVFDFFGLVEVIDWKRWLFFLFFILIIGMAYEKLKLNQFLKI